VYTRHGKSVETTLAQMRFFLFAIQNGVYEYARKKMAEIDKQMATTLSQERERRKKNIEMALRKRKTNSGGGGGGSQPPKKRRRLQSGKKSVPIGSNMPVTLSFTRA
jgi:hypothetical protein